MNRVATREQAHAWELRSAWAIGRTLVLRLDKPAPLRVRGRVVQVAPSGAYALIDDGAEAPLHVPCRLILTIRRPHWTEPTDSPPPKMEDNWSWEQMSLLE